MQSTTSISSPLPAPQLAPAPDAVADGSQPPRVSSRVAGTKPDLQAQERDSPLGSRKRKRESYGKHGVEVAIDELVSRLEPASLARMSNIDRPYQYRQTLLHAAAYAGLPAVAGALLDGGARLEYADCCGATPLHWALREANTKTALMLLGRGANPGHVDTAGHTMLILAVVAESPQLVGRLLEDMPAAAIDGLNINGWAALHYAVGTGRTGVVDLLAQAGADLDRRSPSGLGRTPLMNAVLDGQSSMVARLLALGARPAVEDNAGNTALHYAVSQGETKMAELLQMAAVAHATPALVEEATV